MWLRSLQADGLRNLKSVSVELGAGLTLVLGRNGHGKTSLLEAIYLLSTAHSFRTRRLDDLIARSGGPVRVQGHTAGVAANHDLLWALDDGRRRMFVDGIERDLETFLGRLDLVALHADSMRVLRDGPEGRRRFIDSGIVSLRPAFLRDLGSYRRALASRNALLRNAGTARNTLDAWESQLSAAAARIHRHRRAFVLGLASRTGPAERALFPDGETLSVHYVPSPAGAAEEEPSAFEAAYRETLLKQRHRDVAVGFTGVGPHRDDLEVRLDGVDLRRFGSAGQHRCAMLALCAGKLGQLQLERREIPLFLMDDFDSDLDSQRTASLLQFLRDGGFQAVLATSKDSVVDRLGFPLRCIVMEGGRARAA